MIRIVSIGHWMMWILMVPLLVATGQWPPERLLSFHSWRYQHMWTAVDAKAIVTPKKNYFVKSASN